MTAETRVRVRYAETDQMGVVYHSNYIIWFEVGRAELIRQMGLSYKSMEEQEGCSIAVIEVNARYKASARYDDEVIVRASLGYTRGSIVGFDYVILKDDGETVLCEGSTTHIVVDRQMKRAAMPERFAAAFRLAQSAASAQTSVK